MKPPPYYVTGDHVSTPPILIEVTKITGNRCVQGRGEVLFETHWKGILRLTWERELDLQAFRPKLLAYWASGPDHRQPNTRQYQQLRINATLPPGSLPPRNSSCLSCLLFHSPSSYRNLRLVSLLRRLLVAG